VGNHAEDSLGGETDKEFAHALQGKDFLKGDTVIGRFDDYDARIELLCSTLSADLICDLSQLQVLISNPRYVEDLNPAVARIIECMSLCLGYSPR
jgi:hypothetical protein